MLSFSRDERQLLDQFFAAFNRLDEKQRQERAQLILDQNEEVRRDREAYDLLITKLVTDNEEQQSGEYGRYIRMGADFLVKNKVAFQLERAQVESLKELGDKAVQMNPGTQRGLFSQLSSIRANPDRNMTYQNSLDVFANREEKEKEELAQQLFDHIAKAAHDKQWEDKGGVTQKAIDLIKRFDLDKYFNLTEQTDLKRNLDFLNKLKEKADKKSDELIRQYASMVPPSIQKGDESYGDRVRHLAKFNPESMAMMALCDEIFFIMELMLILTGVKETLVDNNRWNGVPRAMQYDPSLYPWSTDDSAEAKAVRDATRAALLEKKIYPYSIIGGRIQLDKTQGPILDPRLITYEVAMANGLVHKPEKALMLRQANNAFCMKIMGQTFDQLQTIDNAIRHAQASQSQQRQGDFEHEAEAFAAIRPVAAPA